MPVKCLVKYLTRGVQYHLLLLLFILVICPFPGGDLAERRADIQEGARAGEGRPAMSCGEEEFS